MPALTNAQFAAMVDHLATRLPGHDRKEIVHFLMKCRVFPRWRLRSRAGGFPTDEQFQRLRTSIDAAVDEWQRAAA